MVRFVCVSDLHGELINLPPGDFLLISGDIQPGLRQLDLEVKWFNQQFIPWLDKQPHKHKVFIAGNHDFVLEKKLNDLEIYGHGIYLQDSNVVLDGIKIHGTPWSVQFYDWAFMKPDDQLAWYWDHIPDDTQVLLVHGPPYGILDAAIRRSFADNVFEAVGSKTLLKRLKTLSQLKICLFGHIHEAYGVRLENGVYYVNATHYNKSHELGNLPVVLDLEL